MTAAVRTTQRAYPAYKDSGVEWLGEIPEHWEIQRLKFVAQVQPSNVDKKSDEAELPVLLCNYSDVYNNECITADIDFMSATATPAEIKKFSIVEGDVIITKDSESPYDIAVPAYVAETLENTLCGYHLTHIRPESLLGKYLFRLFQCSKFNAQFTVGANGVTRFGLPQYVVSNAAIPLPTLPEQEAIARFLDHKTAQIDALIAKKEALLARLADKRTALISQAVTQGLDPTVPMRDSGIEWLGEIPAHWETTKVGYVSQVVRGQTPRPAGSPEFFYGDVLPWITVGEITRDNSKFLTSTQTMLTEAGVKRSIVFPKGTLVLTNSGATLGVPKILGLTGCMNDGVAALLNINPGMSKDYLFLFLQSMTKSLRDYSQGMGQPNLNTTVISNLSVPKPPLSEQVFIAKAVEEDLQSIETTQTKIQSAIDKLKQYRTALITNAVTGKIDVREAGAWATEAPTSS
jgi:type I restriction enzyme S subunit